MSTYLTARSPGSKTLVLAAQGFGRWTALAWAGRRGSQVLWLCRCACGTERAVLRRNLRNGTSQSCGCLTRETNFKHGHCENGTVSRIYICWKNIRQRCNNPRHPNYSNYGGRGVCEQWGKFETFLAYILAYLGEPLPGQSLDRIDNDGNYAPGNVRWATPLQQSHNRRPSKRKGRRATAEEIGAYSAALARAASLPGARGAL